MDGRPTLRRRKLGRLKRRPEFLAVAGAKRKWAAPGFILQARRHDDRFHPAPGESELRLGLTATKKIGGAVVRNRARRRLRAAAAAVLPGHAAPGHDLVLIARSGTLTRGYADLLADLATGLRRLGLWQDGADPP
ncbi:MAG: ribonuclease P protein component [Azospirillum sp.]|nr:ribonuclease P protein component [Azospirillum sp.]